MTISLTDFTSIVSALTGTITSVYTMLQSAILIDDPISISLFDVAFGFVLLEFLIYTINRFRTPSGDMTGLTMTQEMEGNRYKNDAFLKDFVRRRREIINRRGKS